MRLINGNLSFGELDTEMDEWFHYYDYTECPNPESQKLYLIDQLSAMDAELKFLRPIYNIAIRLIEGDLATPTENTDCLTAMEHDRQADETFDEFIYRKMSECHRQQDEKSAQFQLICDFSKNCIRYVEYKQYLLDVDRGRGFQKECDYLSCILHSFLVVKPRIFHEETGLTFNDLSSMVSKMRKYGGKSTPLNSLCALPLKQWKKICKERCEPDRHKPANLTNVLVFSIFIFVFAIKLLAIHYVI
ncbi:hypothetical protein ACQKWADRAFT_308015 [Trichoderma austrokoningii]